MTPEGRALVEELVHLAEAPGDADDDAVERVRGRLLLVTSGGDSLAAVDLLHHATYEAQWERGRRRGLAVGTDPDEALLLSDLVERLMVGATQERAEEIGLEAAELTAGLLAVWGLLVSLERAVDDPPRTATDDELERALAAQLRSLRSFRATGAP